MILRSPRALFFGICIAVVSVFPVQTSDAALAVKAWGGPGRTTGHAFSAPGAGIGEAQLRSLTESWWIEGGTFTAPIVTNTLVVVGDNGGNDAVRMRAFTLGAGVDRWQRTFGSSSEGAIGPPSTDGNLVFFTVERRLDDGWAQDLFAVRLSNGTTVWKAEIGSTTTRLGPREVAITSGKVLTPTASGAAYKAVGAWSLGTGVYRFSRRPGGPVTSFVASRGRLFIATETTGFAYDLDIGSPIGPMPALIGMKSMAQAGDRIFGTTATEIVAVAATTRETLWSYAAGPDCEPILRVITASFVMASQKGCADGPPIVLSRTGNDRSNMLEGSLFGDVPIVYGDQVLVATSGAGRIKAWNLAPGDVFGNDIAISDTRQPVAFSRYGGPVLAWDRVIVPEIGALQVFAP